MAVPLLDLTAQYESVRDEVHRAIDDVVRSQHFILGPIVERFEIEAAEQLGAKHAIGCASGTDALLLALRALDLDPGDEIIVPSFTFFATAGAVWNAGLRPVFADIDPETFNVTARTVEEVLTDRTRAIIPVHLFGQMADMAELRALAEPRGLGVIEDAAQAFGARQRVDGEWRNAGTVGDFGCFSFFPSKNLGGFGDGGMVTAMDPVLAERVRTLRVHGGKKMYHHEMVGMNSRLDALQAAVLSAKLPHLSSWTSRRQHNAAAYDERLGKLAPRVRTPVALPDNTHVYNQYTLRVERRDELREFLTARGIGTGVYYPVPLHLQPCFADLDSPQLPETERAAGEVISLPVFPELEESDRERVASAIEEFYT